MQEIVDAVPSLLFLDDPAPQMVEQLQDVMRFFDTLSLVAEQVITVPKILPYDVPMRTAVRDTQLAEQLVEVPTIMSVSSLQRIVEQNVAIPVPGVEGDSQEISAAPQFSEERISERIVEQFVDILGGGLQGFRPVQGSPASSSFVSPAGSDDDANEPGEGFFSHFSPP